MPAAPSHAACTPRRGIVVHGRAHALLALQAAREVPGRLLLVSAESAGCFMGPAWWAALMQAVAAERLAAGAVDLLDCGASAGRSMEALRIGLRRLVLAAHCPQYETVRRRGEALGAEVMPVRPACLDLAPLDRRRDRAERVRHWLLAEDATP